MKVEPLTHRALQLDASFHHVGQAAADGQPEARAAVLRAGELSAWRKSSNTRSWSSFLIPIPVSQTAISISLAEASWRADTMTDAAGGELDRIGDQIQHDLLHFRTVVGDGRQLAGRLHRAWRAWSDG